jgi:transposase
MPCMKSNINYQARSKKDLISLIEEKNNCIKQQTNKIIFLEEVLRAYRYRQFAAKTEKMNLHAGQLSFFDEATLPKEPEKILEAEAEIKVAAYVRSKKPGRKPLPADLPRVQKFYDLTEEEKKCACGCVLTYISDEKSEQLEIIPAKVYVIQHIKKKYACKGCDETIKLAKMPIQPIPRSIASSGLLSHVLVSKFQDHLPLFRQEKILRRIGVDIPRATLSLWVIKCAELLSPLMKLLYDHIISYDVAYSDETTVQVLKEPAKSVQSKKYMWLFSGGSDEKFSFYYQYQPSRSHEVAYRFFEEFKGYLHCDGYGAYDALSEKNKAIILVGCLYHARRKFMEVIKISNGKEGIATEVINQIGKLAHIESEIKDEPANVKYEVRQGKSRPILNDLHTYLMNNYPKVPPKSMLGQAVSYTLNQWPKLLTYLQDGRLENNNNRSERAIKPFAIGRKGWLFADSVAGANAAATIFSFVETCKYHGIEPYDWFRYVLQAIPACNTLAELESLLPFNIDKNLLPVPAD